MKSWSGNWKVRGMVVGRLEEKSLGGKAESTEVMKKLEKALTPNGKVTMNGEVTKVRKEVVRPVKVT